jgi:hypothetical protein
MRGRTLRFNFTLSSSTSFEISSTVNLNRCLSVPGPPDPVFEVEVVPVTTGSSSTASVVTFGGMTDYLYIHKVKVKGRNALKPKIRVSWSARRQMTHPQALDLSTTHDREQPSGMDRQCSQGTVLDALPKDIKMNVEGKQCEKQSGRTRGEKDGR